MNKIFLISLLHVLILVPLLLIIYYKRKKINDTMYNIIFYSSIFIIIYHLYKTIIKLKDDLPYVWVNIIHFMIIGPILLFIGYKKNKTPYYIYELLLMIAFAGMGYHLFTLIKTDMTSNDIKSNTIKYKRK